MKKIKIKQVYETPLPDDGYRVLVDRLWPRGLTKEKADLDEWNKEVAPSPEIRTWFAHKPENFKGFGERYKVELNSKTNELKRLKKIAHKQNLTLLYAAKDKKINHAVILLNVLSKIEK